MMKYITLSLSIFILFVLQACTKQSKVEKKGLQYNLIITDSLEVNIPTNIQNPLETLNGFWNYTDSLFCSESDVNNDTININCYNFYTKNWRQIQLPLKGVNQVFSSGTFKFISDSTFLYFPSIIPNILLIDRNGKVIRNYKYSDNMKILQNNVIKAPQIFFNDSTFSFDITEYRSLSDSKTYEESKLYGIYNFKKNHLKTIISFPEEFKNGIWSSNDVERNSVVLNNKIIVNFSKSSQIYLFDFDGTIIKKKIVKFNEIKDAKPLPTKKLDAQKKWFRKENNGYYSNLIYDKWRKVFYRTGIFYEKSSQIRDFSDLQRVLKKRKLGIITFNEELKILSKTIFDFKLSDTYYVVNKKGFFLVKNNTLKENVLEFYKLELKK